MKRHTNQRHIRALDPEQAFQAIYRTTMAVDFPWHGELGMNLAFYRTFAIPTIAALLAKTGKIRHHTRRRADDTGILMFTLIEHGFDHPHGVKAVRQLNRIHRRFTIDPADHLYVLGATLIIPLRVINRYGWRTLCCHEFRAAHAFYRELGNRMGIENIPASYEEFEYWFDSYEADHFRFSPEAHRLMESSRSLLVERFPRMIAPLMARVSDALLDLPLQRAMGISPTPWPVRAGVHAALRVAANLQRCFPDRITSVYADGINAATYPDGYDLGNVGTPTTSREVRQGAARVR